MIPGCDGQTDRRTDGRSDNVVYVREREKHPGNAAFIWLRRESQKVVLVLTLAGGRRFSGGPDNGDNGNLGNCAVWCVMQTWKMEIVYCCTHCMGWNRSLPAWRQWCQQSLSSAISRLIPGGIIRTWGGSVVWCLPARRWVTSRQQRAAADDLSVAVAAQSAGHSLAVNTTCNRHQILTMATPPNHQRWLVCILCTWYRCSFNSDTLTELTSSDTLEPKFTPITTNLFSGK